MGGCRIAGRRKLGLVASPSFHLGLGKAVVDAFCKFVVVWAVFFTDSGNNTLLLMFVLLSVIVTKGLSVSSFNSTEDFYHDVKSNVSNEYCFGFEVSDISANSEEVNVTYMFPRDASLDTH